jgi:hypothetical protein
MGGVSRYDRFSMLTDPVYANASVTHEQQPPREAQSRPPPDQYIPRALQLDTGARLATTVWSLSGGYTLLQGAWGNLAAAGVRTLFIGSTTNYLLAADILLPNNTIGLSRTGSLNLGTIKVEGIGDATGRINIPNSSFYLPFYLDASGGSVPFTWQAYSGGALERAASISVGYR